MKFLIAGFGSIGRRHFRNLISLGEKDIIILRSNKGTLPTDELHGHIVETDLRKALAHGPDVAIISNPTALHLDIAIPAAEKGCHLFIEKPISHDLDKVKELSEIVAKSGSKVFVAYQFRYHPGLLKLRQWLKHGVVGNPLSVRVHWGEYLPDWHPWEDYRKAYSARSDLGGGVILTLSHPLDYLWWLFGDVKHLWALSVRNDFLGLEVEDTAEIGLRFKSNIVGSIHLNYNQRPASHRMEIVCSHGTIYWDNLANKTCYYDVSKQEYIENEEQHLHQRNDMFMAEMKHFLDVIGGNDRDYCSLQDGTYSLQLALKSRDSANSGRMIDFEKEFESED